MLSAIIVAAGRSRRMGFDKLCAPLGQHTVLWHTLKGFADTREVSEILLVVQEDRLAEFSERLAADPVGREIKLVGGGDERHLSVWNGLQSLQKSEFVAIHDGARPLVTPALIRACLELAETHGAACCASPIPDTVKRASTDHVVQESVDRNGLWAMQTPQIFGRSLILEAYASVMAKHEMVTDEVSAVQRLGRKIALLKNEDWNFKITYPNDLELAAHVLDLRGKKSARAPRKTAKAVAVTSGRNPFGRSLAKRSVKKKPQSQRAMPAAKIANPAAKVANPVAKVANPAAKVANPAKTHPQRKLSERLGRRGIAKKKA
jgi:2-C-methyl-D-erythritol 4-phosphate cytidylyltransferase